MSNELTLRQAELTLLTEQKSMEQLLRPLTREIHLFDSYVAGTALLKEPEVLQSIQAEDTLSLRREESRFDEHAIALYTAQGKKCGYVPEKDDVIFARLLDAGKHLTAKVQSVQVRHGITQIRMGIYLVDF